jgi:Fe-S-cluster containining protein
MRKLPVLMEKCVAEAKRMQIGESLEFEQQARAIDTPLCRKGCSNCCHYPIMISILEGILLYRSLKSNGRWTSQLRAKLEHTKNLTLGLSMEVWLMSNIPCPLLDETKACSAYDGRPLHCRTTFSTRDPYMCHPHELGAGTGLVDNSDVVVRYNTELYNMLKKASVKGVILPLSEAVLLGAQVDTGEIAIEDVVSRYSKELSNG